jgi:adenosylcobyric acid synthase
MVIGICGGLQMLGRSLRDPEGIEGAVREAEGLGLLAIDTGMDPEKHVRDVRAICLRHDVDLDGYEIHLGRTSGPDCARPFALIDGVKDGATSPDGRVFGTYLHGLFGSADFRKALLSEFGVAGGGFDHEAEVERALEAIAAHLEMHLDCDALFALAR